MRQKWTRMVFRRRVIVIFMLLLQALLMTFMIYSSSRAYKWIHNALYLMSIAVVLHVFSSEDRPSYKLIWSLVVLSVPLFGGFLYLLVKIQNLSNTGFRKKFASALQKTVPFLEQDAETEGAFLKDAPEQASQFRFLTKCCGFRAYKHESAEFFPSGEAFWTRLLETLEKAESFIFLEYFIIEEGCMWNEILTILKKKAAKGVDVRLIYDDLGCFMLLPLDYDKTLEKMGIRCRIFNKFRPALSTLQNNRDHRKIAIIDGKWAFTGGANLADEYINKKEKHGHWKDAAVLLRGAPANSFTMMFLSLWSALTGENEDFEKFYQIQKETDAGEGFSIPYSDNPFDREYVAEQVYTNMIASAKEYLYIETPYLVIDDVMNAALITAAKSGVDVRILLPHVPDKWYVHMTTRSYYADLIRGGVKIYEYTPGFLHAKVWVADDAVATVGSVNLDFRSLYLHFECGTLLVNSSAVSDIKEDFLKTLEKSKQMSPKDCKVNVFQKFLQNIFRLFAPLM